MKKTAGRSAAARLVHSVLPAAPSLREFWAELRRAQAMGAPLPSAPIVAGAAEKTVAPAAGAAATAGAAAADSPAPVPAPAGAPAVPVSTSGSGFGSSGGGYGVALIVPDEDSRLRIARIMSELCRKDTVRRKKK